MVVSGHKKNLSIFGEVLYNVKYFFYNALTVTANLDLRFEALFL